MDQSCKFSCMNVVSTNQTAEKGRHALLEWINIYSPVTVTKVESLCSGYVYCYHLNILFPGCLSLMKVKKNATLEHEKMKNLKYLQTALRSVGCNKEVPVCRLANGRFQDNLEFLQWFKKFFDVNFHVSIDENTYIESELHDRTVLCLDNPKPSALVSPFTSDGSVRKKTSSSKPSPVVAQSSHLAMSDDVGRDVEPYEIERRNLPIRKLKAELEVLYGENETFQKETDFYHLKLLRIKQLLMTYVDPSELDAQEFRDKVLDLLNTI